MRERDTFVSMAYTDPLTGLPNWRGLDVPGRRDGRERARLLAVCMIDLDGFWAGQRLHGHELGDELLVAVGRRLGAQMRSRTPWRAWAATSSSSWPAGFRRTPARDLGLKLVEAFREIRSCWRAIGVATSG